MTEDSEGENRGDGGRGGVRGYSCGFGVSVNPSEYLLRNGIIFARGHGSGGILPREE